MQTHSKTALAVSIAVLLVSPKVFALDNLWQGDEVGDETNWNNPNNWSEGRVPTNSGNDEDAVININTPFFPVITEDTLGVPRDLKVGLGTGTNGRVDHRAGINTQGGGNWGFIGTSGGTGVYNLADTTTTGGATTGFGTGSGTFNTGQRLYIGGTEFGDLGGTGTLNINTTGELKLGSLGTDANNGGIRLGYSGTGTINMDAGTLTSQQTRIGEFQFETAAQGTMNLSGGTWNNSGFMMVGSGGTGAVNQTGGAVNVGGGWFGTGYGGTGSYNISGGELNITPIAEIGADTIGTMAISGTGAVNATGSPFVVGLRNGGNGTVTMTGGTLTVASDFRIGEQNNSVGTVNLSGGTISVTGALNMGLRDNAKGNITVGGTGVLTFNTARVGWGTTGAASTTNGQFTVNEGGTVNATGGNTDAFQIGDNHGTGTLTVNGGAINFTNGGNMVLGWGGTASGTVAQSGGSISGLGSLQLGGGNITPENNSGTQIYNLTGGSISAANINLARGNAGTSTFNHSGGVVSISANLDVQGASVGTYNLSGGVLSVEGSIDATNGIFSLTGSGRLTRATTGAIDFDGDLATGGINAGFNLGTDKTFDVSGILDTSTGVAFDITGLVIPANPGGPALTGFYILGAVGSVANPFNTTNTGIIGLINNAGATFINEGQGEGMTFDPNTSVFWVQENAGAVTLQYSVVPEPGTAGLLGLAGLLLAARRRRQS